MIGIGPAELIVLLVVIGLSVWALFQLRSRLLSDVTLLLRVVVIGAIPLLGPLAFFIVRPGRGER